MKVSLIFSVLFLATAFAQTPNECSFTCKETSKPNTNNNGNWAVILNNGISYFYLIKYNAFVIVNIELQIVVIANGNDGTLTMLYPNTGFGGLVNISTNLSYFFSDSSHTFDIWSLSDQDYSVVTDMVVYSQTYTSKVVGNNIDTTQKGYSQLEIIFHDYATTTDYTQWASYQGEDNEQSRVEVAKIMNELFASKNYTVEWGASMYIVVVTEMYKYDDVLLQQFNDFAVSIVRTLKGQYTSDLMEIYYQIITSQSSIKNITEDFRNLTWAINGVGTTYETLNSALKAYETQTVVQTYVSTIIVGNNSYVAYNSMRNGTWIFRITYSTEHYVQVTSSYNDEYMGIFDPSLEYVMVFTKTNQFALINYKTGNGLIIDGHSQLATYVISKDQNIIDAFAEKRYKDGFKLVQALAEGTTLDNSKSFNVLDFFKAVKNGDSLDSFLNAEQLASYQSDFSTLAGNLKNVNFDNESGLSNIVGMMLAGPNSDFFQLGFVKMVNSMFYFQLCSGRLYRIAYAGILNSIDTNWAEPIFNNLVVVMGYLKPNNDKAQLLQFLENFVLLSWGIDVTDPRFTIDGSYIK